MNRENKIKIEADLYRILRNYESLEDAVDEIAEYIVNRKG